MSTPLKKELDVRKLDTSCRDRQSDVDALNRMKELEQKFMNKKKMTRVSVPYGVAYTSRPEDYEEKLEKPKINLYGN